jgi:hypothetical protein
VLLFILALFCWDRAAIAPGVSLTRQPIPRHELVLAIACLMLPFAGFVIMRTVRGPFIDRYFLTSTTGLALLLGAACSTRNVRSWISSAVLGCIVFLAAGSLVRMVSARLNLEERTYEPSSGWQLNNTGVPTAHHALLFKAEKNLDILVSSGLDYIYLYRYMPPEISRRLWYCTRDEHDSTLGLFRKFQDTVAPSLRIGLYSDFLATHRRFLVYSGVGVDFQFLAQLSTERGAIIKDARSEKEQTLYRVELR